MTRSGRLSRREALAILGAAGTTAVGGHLTRIRAAQPAPVDGALARNDAAVRTLLAAQITDTGSAWRGSVPDQFGLHSAGSAGGVAETLTASFVHPRSAFH